MAKKLLWNAFLSVWALGMISCAGPEAMSKREEIYGKAIPIVHQSFASKQVWRGQTWKVYLNASDPDGDMKEILCTIEQPGVGIYPVSMIEIGVEYQKEFSGYIYLNTQALYDLTFENLTLTIQIRDKAGHSGQPTVFPLSLSTSSQQEPPPPNVFQEADLGPIMIHLRSPQDGNPLRLQQGIFFY